MDLIEIKNSILNWKIDRQVILEYFYEGLAVGLAISYVVPGVSFVSNLIKIFMITILYMILFSTFDHYSPDISSGARKGSGIAIGIFLIMRIFEKIKSSSLKSST